MRTKLANWTRMAVVVVVVAGSQTGCKSGWKMPGADMFSWSRKPSETTLAGSSPSLAMPSSPAQKSTPSPLVSSAANGGRPSSPYGPSATNPGFGAPSAGNPLAMGGAGTAANANGYTNGPYGMVTGNQPRPGQTAPSSFGAPTGYTASNTPPTGYAAAPTNTFATNQGPALPPAYGGPTNATSTVAYSSIGGGGVPTTNVGFNPGNMPMPSQNNAGYTSMPNALPSGTQPSSMPSMATQAYNGAAPYRPGSVARTTGYDFSNQGGGVAASSNLPAPAAIGLPPSVPATANNPNGPVGLPNGMYR